VKITVRPLSAPSANYFLRHFAGALQRFRGLKEVVREVISTTGGGMGKASLVPLYFALPDIGAL
jgi:hypothetical protein